MHDDAVEAAEQAAPELELVRRPSWQEVVGGEDERRPRAERARVDLGSREPLEVEDVRRPAREAREAERVLDRLQRQPQARAPEQPRAERVEEVVAPVAVGLGRLAEAEARRGELDVRARAGERRRQLVVVLGSERGRVGEDDPHRTPTVVRCSIRTWNVFHGRSHPPGRTLYLERMVGFVTEDRPEILCLQEVPPWALARLGEWSGMAVFGEVAARPSIGPLPSTA